MSVLSPDEIANQILLLQESEKSVVVELVKMRDKIKSLEDAMAENHLLRETVAKLYSESFSFWEEEWARKTTYFPDIIANILDRFNNPDVLPGAKPTAAAAEEPPTTTKTE